MVFEFVIELTSCEIILTPYKLWLAPDLLLNFQIYTSFQNFKNIF